MMKTKLARLSLAGLLLFAPFLTHASGGTSRNATSPARQAGAKSREIKLFLVAIDDGGRSGRKIGCNDSLVSVRRAVSTAPAPLRAAIEELLKLPEKSEAGQQMYNALHQSKLRLSKVSVSRGEAVIHLSGRLVTGGVCDSPRVQAQLEETARQFSSVRSVKVYINGTPLAKHLSERG